MADEIRRSVPAIMAEAAAAPDKSLMDRILEFMLGYGIQTKDAVEHSAALTLWVEALRGLPIASVNHGMVEASRTCTFLPKPGDVYKAAKPHALDLQMVAYRAKRALEGLGAAPVPKSQKMTRAEMIAAGFMDENGKIIMAVAKPIPPGQKAVLSPQELADKLRASGERKDEN